jgi:hypothetical protein
MPGKLANFTFQSGYVKQIMVQEILDELRARWAELWRWFKRRPAKADCGASNCATLPKIVRLTCLIHFCLRNGGGPHLLCP